MLLVIGMLIFQSTPQFQAMQKQYSKVENKSYSKLKLYKMLCKIPGAAAYVEKIKLQLELLIQLDEFTLREKTINLLFISFLFTLGIFLCLTFIVEINIFNVFSNVLLCTILYFNIVATRIAKYDTILEQLLKVIGYLKHFYMLDNIILNAFDGTIKTADKEISLHLKKIRNILALPYNTATRLLKEYNETCPNKYLKVLGAYSLMVQEYGDKIDSEGRSAYNSSLQNLLMRIQMDYRNQRKIAARLMGGRIFILVPLVILPLIQKHVLGVDLFPDLVTFYASSKGYFLKLLYWVIVLVILMVFNELTLVTKSDIKIQVYGKTWEDYILELPIISQIINFITPKKKKSFRFQLRDKWMMNTGIVDTIERYWLKKLLMMFVTAIIVVGVLIAGRAVEIKSIYEDPVFGEEQKTLAYSELALEQGKLQRIISTDKIVLDFLIYKNKILLNSNAEDRKKIIVTTLKEMIEKEQIKREDIKVKRITGKIDKMRDSIFFIGDFAFGIILILLTYWVPDGIMCLAVHFRKDAMDEEVMRYKTLALILMEHQHATVEHLIEWMIWFSDIFRDKLLKIKTYYNDREYGGVMIISEVAEEIEFKEMQHFMHNLLLAAQQSSLKTAFAEIYQDQMFNIEMKKDRMEEIMQFKISLAGGLAMGSIAATMIIYLGIPFGIYTYDMFNKTNQMQSEMENSNRNTQDEIKNEDELSYESNSEMGSRIVFNGILRNSNVSYSSYLQKRG